MKKIIAILLCVAAIFCLAVPASAAVKSPVGEQKIKITIINIPGTTGITEVYEVDDKVVAKFDPKAGKFDSWSFYLPDGTLAVLNDDYIIVEGSKDTETVTVQSKVGHLIIVANYDGKITNPLTGEASKPTSPTTGNAVVIYAALVMLAGAAVVFSSKKVSC